MKDQLERAQDIIMEVRHLQKGYQDDRTFREQSASALTAAQDAITQASTEVEKLQAEKKLLTAALEEIVKACTLRGVYVGDFYKDATKRVKQIANGVLNETL